MLVLVMAVMDMPVIVLHGVMRVMMDVPFRKMKPGSNRHENTCNAYRDSQWCPENNCRGESANEGGRPIVCASPCGAEVTQCDNEQHKSQPVTHKAK